MASLREMRRKARKEDKLIREQEQQRELSSIVHELVLAHKGERDFLVQVVGKLNAMGVLTPTGREWTSKNLWAYLQKDHGYDIPGRDQEIPSAIQEGAKEVLAIAGRLAELGSILQWRCERTGKKKEAVLLSIDADVLELWKKKQQLAETDETLDQAFERFLREDLASEA